MKYIAFTLALIVGMAANAAVTAANIVTLRNNITVEGQQITFGDVFNGAGDLEDYVIASSPAPGKNIIFKATSLAFVARKHGLDWQPQRSLKRITVKRAGIRIAQQHILEEIHMALEAELQSDMFELSLSSFHPNIQVAPDEDPAVTVESLSYNAKNENFVVVLSAPANSENARRYKVSGKFYRQKLLPVAARIIHAGEKIADRDLEYKVVRTSKISRNTIVDAIDIIGKSPRRSIRPGAPLSLNNLGEPVTVQKGKLLSVTLKNGGIKLSITGRALEDGAEGDIIRVENVNSRKTILAQIISEREVRIVTAKQRLAALR